MHAAHKEAAEYACGTQAGIAAVAAHVARLPARRGGRASDNASFYSEKLVVPL